MGKLTEAQKRALNTLLQGRVAYTEWGGKTLTGLPEGIKNRGTLFALHREGPVRTWRGDGFKTVWAITDAGRAALERSEG